MWSEVSFALLISDVSGIWYDKPLLYFYSAFCVFMDNPTNDTNKQMQQHKEINNR